MMNSAPSIPASVDSMDCVAALLVSLALFALSTAAAAAFLS
jgi:hypothetical protein